MNGKLLITFFVIAFVAFIEAHSANPEAHSTHPEGHSTNPERHSTNPEGHSTNPEGHSTNPEARVKCVPLPAHKHKRILECKKDRNGRYHRTGHGRYSVNNFGIIMDPCNGKGDQKKLTCSGLQCCVPKKPKEVKTYVKDHGRIRECQKKANGKYKTFKRGGNIEYVVTKKGKKMDPCKSPNLAFQNKKGDVCCIKSKGKKAKNNRHE